MRRIKAQAPCDNRLQKIRKERQKTKAKFMLVGFFMLILGGGIGGLTWLWQEGYFTDKYQVGKEIVIGMSSDLGLKVDDILVEGRKFTQKQNILTALEVTEGTPILSFNPQLAQNNLEKLPWIESAYVERRYPSAIYVNITERNPIAIWQAQGKVGLIDKNGHTIEHTNLTHFKHLPIIVGEEAPFHTPQLLANLAQEPHLLKNVTSAVYVGKRRWDIVLNNGISVRLPEKNPEAAWTQLSALDQEHQLLSKDIVTIDLRLSDRMVIRLAKETKKKKNKTSDLKKIRDNLSA
jgi:cell division protein FtsQ